MKDNHRLVRALERLHKATIPISKIITWLGFGVFVVGSAMIDFPNGLWYGLILGTAWLLFSFGRDRWARKEWGRVLATSSALAEGRSVPLPRQTIYSLIVLLGLGLFLLTLLLSCVYYPCGGGSNRFNLIAPLLGAAIIVEELFLRERVKGRVAGALAILLTILAAVVIGKTLAFF